MFKNHSVKIISALIITVALTGAIFYTQYLTAEGSRGEQNDSINYEVVATTERCIDGDTIEVKISRVLDPHEGVEKGRAKIRFAGIDTEETKIEEAVGTHEDLEGLTQREYEKTQYYQHAIGAKNLTSSLTTGENVYLDIDDLAGGKKPYRGRYGRIIAVVYMKKDGEWRNVNAAVLREGFPEHVKITPFKSEFRPSKWLDDEYPYA